MQLVFVISYDIFIVFNLNENLKKTFQKLCLIPVLTVQNQLLRAVEFEKLVTSTKLDLTQTTLLKTIIWILYETKYKIKSETNNIDLKIEIYDAVSRCFLETHLCLGKLCC